MNNIMIFNKNEIVVLRPEFNDTNFRRTFVVLNTQENLISVAKKTEQDVETGLFLKIDDTLSIGVFEDNLFEKYL